MNEHNQASEKSFEENHSYRTGSTKPPKDYGGRVTAILVALIFLCGIASALGMLNVKLFGEQKPHDENKSPVSFDAGDQENPDLPLAGEAADWPEAGLSGEFFSEEYRRYYGLPAGAHITKVQKASPAEQAGILAGDILTAVNGTPIENAQILQTALENTQAGQTLGLEVYRNHQTISVVLTIAQ